MKQRSPFVFIIEADTLNYPISEKYILQLKCGLINSTDCIVKVQENRVPIEMFNKEECYIGCNYLKNDEDPTYPFVHLLPRL